MLASGLCIQKKQLQPFTCFAQSIGPFVVALPETDSPKLAMKPDTLCLNWLQAAIWDGLLLGLHLEKGSRHLHGMICVILSRLQ